MASKKTNFSTYKHLYFESFDQKCYENIKLPLRKELKVFLSEFATNQKTYLFFLFFLQLFTPKSKI